MTITEKTLNIKELDGLLTDSKLIMQDSCGPKVIELNNQDYLKFFRLKTWFSSRLFYHCADRFINNSLKLKQLGIPTVSVTSRLAIPRRYLKNSIRSVAVQYKPLHGVILRDLITENKTNNNLIKQFAIFIAKLHNLGLYFRAAHFGNIVYSESFPEHFGLIDIDSIIFYNRPLSNSQRLRNLKHMQRYPIDKQWLNQYKQDFIKYYSRNIISSSKKFESNIIELL